MTLLLASAALAATYTDHVGGDELQVPIEYSWEANLYEVETPVVLEQVTLSMYIYVSPGRTTAQLGAYLRDTGTDDWTLVTTVFQIPMSETPAPVTFTLSPAVRLEAGQQIAIAVTGDYGVDVMASVTPGALDTSWGDALGYAVYSRDAGTFATPSDILGIEMEIVVSGVDDDGDGHDTYTDCDDIDGAVFPGAADDTTDGVDQDCDGTDGPAEVDTGTPDTGDTEDSGDDDDTGTPDTGDTQDSGDDDTDTDTDGTDDTGDTDSDPTSKGCGCTSGGQVGLGALVMSLWIVGLRPGSRHTRAGPPS